MINFIENAYKKIVPVQRKWRLRVFGPLINLFIRLGITPNMLSHFRILLIIPFFLSISVYPKLAGIIIIISLISDFVDGPLARQIHKASDRGMFTDLFADNIFYYGVVASFLASGQMNVLWGVYHIIIYGAHDILAILVHNEGKKSNWIIKPYAQSGYYKGIMYVIFLLFLLFNIDSITITLWLITLLITYETIYYYIALHWRWAKSD